jgi:hypothetical protein
MDISGLSISIWNILCLEIRSVSILGLSIACLGISGFSISDWNIPYLSIPSLSTA